jgi:hypothetical protein
MVLRFTPNRRSGVLALITPASELAASASSTAAAASASASAASAAAASASAANAAASAAQSVAYNNKAAVQAATISGVDSIFVAGHTTVGKGAARYKNVGASEPAHDGKIQSDDGDWWEITEPRIDVKMFGAVGDGSTADDAAIASAHAFADHVYFPAGEYRIDNNMTWPAGKTYEFLAGAKLDVDAGATVTIRGPFICKSLEQIFTGSGTVTGIREVHPEWWGAVNDGATVSAAAFQKAEDCMEGSYTSEGPDTCLLMQCGNYMFEATVDCTPSASGTIRWRGQGGSGTTQIIGKASGFTGTEVVWVHSASGNVSLEFKGFRIIPETASSGAAIGMRIGDTTLNAFITGGYSESCKFVDVNSYEFAYCWSLTNIRLCKFERCGGWVQTVTNGRALYIFSDATSGSPQDSYVGDLNFDTCQFVAATDTATGALCLDIASSNEGYIAGIRFPACILYIGPSNLTATVDATLQDIWFTSGWQYDNLDGEGFTLATNTGGNINNINFVDGYMVSSQVNAGRAVNITTLGGSRVPTGVRIERNRIAQFTNDVIEIAGSKMCRVVGNNFIDCDNGDCITFTGGVGHIFKDNIVLQTDGASTVATIVNHVGSSNYYVISDNISNGFAGAAVSDGTPGANLTVTGNI